MNLKELIQKLKDMKSQDIRLVCGEITAQEMRTSKAIINYVVFQESCVRNPTASAVGGITHFKLDNL